MTNEFPGAAVVLAPLGSAVFAKSRIARYFASLVAAVLRAIRRTDAVRRPWRGACKSFRYARRTRVHRHERLGLSGLALASLCRHAGEALARGRVAHVRRARDQRLVLHADQAGDLRTLARRDSRRVSVRAQGPPVRDPLQAAPRVRRLGRAAARSGERARNQARGGRLAAAEQLRA